MAYAVRELYYSAFRLILSSKWLEVDKLLFFWEKIYISNISSL